MIYIGIPSYDGKLHHSTMGGLFNTAYAMGKYKTPVCLDIIPHDCFIDHARELMAKRFLSIPDATDMVMIDADVGFAWSDFEALMKVDADVVAGVYPYKEDDEHYPVALRQPIEKRGRLVKMVYGPAGFMRIRRKVLATLSQTVTTYTDSEHGEMHEFFPITKGGTRRGEDAGFCMLAAKAGFSVVALEGLDLQHTGDKTWRGKWDATKRGATYTKLEAAA